MFVVVGRHACLCRGTVPFDKKRLAWLMKKRSTLDEYARSAYTPVIARYGGVVFPENAHRLPHLLPDPHRTRGYVPYDFGGPLFQALRRKFCI